MSVRACSLSASRRLAGMEHVIGIWAMWGHPLQNDCEVNDDSLIGASPMHTYAYLCMGDFSLPPLNAACGNKVNLSTFCHKMPSL